MSSPSSWLDRLPSVARDFVDGQRMERLRQCRDLEALLHDCRNNHHHQQQYQLEDFPMGLRLVRYFQWRNIEAQNCVREEHAVWACRAVGLGCGTELVDLRDCFRENADDVLEAPPAYWTKSNNESNAVCGQFQHAIAQCVHREATELAKRQGK